MIRGLIFDGEACPACQHPWPVTVQGREVGYVTTAIWSLRFEQNIALAMVERGYWEAGTEITVLAEDGIERRGRITDLPMEG
jgi:dimethylsulfoniopropionate demethylase